MIISKIARRARVSCGEGDDGESSVLAVSSVFWEYGTDEEGLKLLGVGDHGLTGARSLSPSESEWGRREDLGRLERVAFWVTRRCSGNAWSECLKTTLSGGSSSNTDEGGSCWRRWRRRSSLEEGVRWWWLVLLVRECSWKVKVHNINHSTTQKARSCELSENSSFLVRKANVRLHASVDWQASILGSSSNYTPSFPNVISATLDLEVNRSSARLKPAIITANARKETHRRRVAGYSVSTYHLVVFHRRRQCSLS